MLWRHDAAMDKIDGVPSRFRRGPPLSAAAPIMRHPHNDEEQSDASQGTGGDQNEDEDDEESDSESNPEAAPEADPEDEDEEEDQEEDEIMDGDEDDHE
jgi:hypothetical protein